MYSVNIPTLPCRSVSFKNKAEGTKRIISEEIIEEVKEDEIKPPPTKLTKPNIATAPSKTVGTSQPLVKRKTPLVLVKPKAPAAAASTIQTTKEVAEAVTSASSSLATSSPATTNGASKPVTAAAPAGLSLLAAYSDSSEDSN